MKIRSLSFADPEEAEHSGIEYAWKYDGVAAGEADERESHVRSEELWIGAPDRVETSLFVRTAAEFRCGVKEVPKLAKTSTAIYLLREEEAIKPVHEALADHAPPVLERRFRQRAQSSTNTTSPD